MFKIFQRFCSTSKHWSLERLTETNMLSITNLQAEQKYHYPFVWLRDNCQCPQCFNATSKSRIMDLKTNLKVKPIDIDIQRAFDTVSNDLEKSTDVIGESGTGNVGSNDVKSGDFNLNIRWEDNHRSEFPLDWLIARNFTAANRVRLDEIYRIPRIPWRTILGIRCSQNLQALKVCPRYGIGFLPFAFVLEACLSLGLIGRLMNDIFFFLIGLVGTSNKP
ncbi:uncharacterized protein LOC113466416 [Diaphorina citri]|uniref:Uncharacterized protein LOC113466416 n=1 Tax=Diaphorina citri TaxID=121845 RepID=A0A3Q0ISH4_DIACI|nr:uncharacterized protein LOC113466416 [Diaphorina citri]